MKMIKEKKFDFIELMNPHVHHTILMGINRDAVNGKSKRHVRKIIEQIYEDVLQDADKSEQDKKTYLIGTINEVTTIMQKPDNKEFNTKTSRE